MKKEILQSISEHFSVIFPLFHKKIFGHSSIDTKSVHLSPTSMHALIMLNELRSATVSEISKQLNISRPNMTPLIDKLIQSGFVTRKTREDDRRVIQIDITPKGDNYCRTAREHFSAKIKSTLQTLDDADLTELDDSLARLKSILIKINSTEGDPE